MGFKHPIGGRKEPSHDWMEALSLQVIVGNPSRALSWGLLLGSAWGALTVLLAQEFLRVF